MILDIQQQLEDMTVPELEAFRSEALQRIAVLRRQQSAVRDALRRQAKQAGLSEAEAEILFGGR